MFARNYHFGSIANSVIKIIRLSGFAYEVSLNRLDSFAHRKQALLLCHGQILRYMFLFILLCSSNDLWLFKAIFTV